MTTFEYFEADHTYAIDGRPAPGVNHELGLAGLLDGMIAPEDILDRGRRVHLAVELYLTLEVLKLRPHLTEEEFDWYKWFREKSEDYGYLKSFVAAMATGRMRVMHTELLVGNKELHYCTQIDQVGTFDDQPACFNTKTGERYPHYPIQMAGEALCLGEPTPLRVGVYLNADGSFDPATQFVVYDDPRDFDVWRWACGISDFKTRNGIGFRTKRRKPAGDAKAQFPWEQQLKMAPEGSGIFNANFMSSPPRTGSDELFG